MIEQENTPSVNITSYNRKRVRDLKNEKIKIRKRRVFASALAAINLLVAIAAYQVGKNNQEIAPEPFIPSGYILTETVEIIDSGDTVYDIASEYYNVLYTTIYPTLNDYTRAIQEQNNLNNSAKIKAGDSLRLPVVISSQNDYFLQALEIQKQIDEITQNNYWIQYTVKLGDTISALAAKASGDFRETPLLTQKILDKNDLDGVLRDGTVIWIINPELGPLKLQLQEIQEHFQESIKVSQDQNENTNTPKTH